MCAEGPEVAFVGLAHMCAFEVNTLACHLLFCLRTAFLNAASLLPAVIQSHIRITIHAVSGNGDGK